MSGIWITDENAATYGIPEGQPGSQLVDDAQTIYDVIHNKGLATRADIDAATASWSAPDRVNAALGLLGRLGRLLGPL